jgi:hypothetical protein
MYFDTCANFTVKEILELENVGSKRYNVSFVRNCQFALQNIFCLALRNGFIYITFAEN